MTVLFSRNILCTCIIYYFKYMNLYFDVHKVDNGNTSTGCWRTGSVKSLYNDFHNRKNIVRKTEIL